MRIGSGHEIFKSHGWGEVGSGHPDPTRPARSDPTREPPPNIGSSRGCRVLNTYRAEHEVAANPDTNGKDCTVICMH